MDECRKHALALSDCAEAVPIEIFRRDASLSIDAVPPRAAQAAVAHRVGRMP